MNIKKNPHRLRIKEIDERKQNVVMICENGNSYTLTFDGDPDSRYDLDGLARLSIKIADRIIEHHNEC